MKRRILSFTLAVIMLLSVTVLSMAEVGVSENVTSTTSQCPCGCETVVKDVEWKPYNVNEDGNLSSGHYYLAEDYVQEGSQLVIMAGDNVVIDLRGHTLTTAYNGRLYLIYGNMYVMDTVGGGQMMSKTSGGGYGGVIMMSINENASSLFELHSGTLTVDPEGKSSLRGGIVSVGQCSTFRMLGGVVTGGSTVLSSGLYSQGGALAAITNSATIEILGGTVMNCSSASDGGCIYSVGTTILKNCRILGGSAQGNGGNIYQSGGSLTMENCEIAYGTANGSAGGGNIYINNTKLTDQGSTIRDGFAMGSGSGGGGNLYVGTGTHTLKGTTIRGGVSQKYGANIVNWSDSAVTRMEDCTIDGDVRWAGNSLTLAGKTKIGLRGNGLNLVGGSAGSVISAGELTDGAEIFVCARWGVFTSDSVNADYFKPAMRTVLTQLSDGTLKGGGPASGKAGGYCPHCYDPADPQQVVWTAFGDGTQTITSGHYYLSKAVTDAYQVDGEVVIDLNGKTLTSTGKAFTLTGGDSLSILDFSGAGSVTGVGGVVTGSGYTLKVYGGRLSYQAPETEDTSACGGVICATESSQISIYGGTLDGSAFQSTGENNQGGVVYLDNTANTFTMTGGRVIGGTAYRGGAMVFGAGNQVSITGGVITGGTAVANGGNIRAYGSATQNCVFDLQDCAVLGGQLTTDGTGSRMGGSIQATYSDTTIDNCYILGGQAVGTICYGGNLSIGTGNVEITDSIIASGIAPKGGNIYVASLSAEVTLTDTLVTRGQAVVPEGSTSASDGCGGNLFLNAGRTTITGGETSFGVAERSGGNAYLHAGNTTSQSSAGAADDKVILTGAPRFLVGKAGAYGGNIYTDAKLDLLDCYLTGGQAAELGDDLYLQTGTYTLLTWGADVKGSIRMGVADALVEEGIYGSPIKKTSVGTLNADIRLENAEGEPGLLSRNGQLFVASVSVVDGQENIRWHGANDEAMADCGENEYMKLYTDGSLELTKNVIVDLNGHQLQTSGSGVISGMDSSGDNCVEGTGKITLSGSAQAAGITYAPNGKLYVSLTEGSQVTCHRLDMKISDVALRTNTAGLYYKAQWNCDDTLMAQIQEYGIVMSTTDMPDSGFAAEGAENHWVTYGADTLEKGTKKCSEITVPIFSEDATAAQNKLRGETPIYATAYITLADGSTFVSDAPGAEDDIGYSIYSYLQMVDRMIQEDPTNFRRLEKPLKEFYAKWENRGCGDWEFDRITAPVDPATDDELNFLIFSSSSGYYWVEELQALLTNAGYKNVRVCNLYYSGCRFQWHYEWWRDGKSNYQLFVTDDNGRRMTEGVSLEYGLSQYNWDFIGTLETSSYIRYSSNDAQVHYNKIKKYLDAVIPYVQSEFPMAKMFYQEGWANQIGYDGNGYQVNSWEDQEHDMSLYRGLSSLICPVYGLERVNLGEAWQIYRTMANASDTDGLEDTLCARLGKTVSGAAHEGDFAHDGDIGGGQLLNACVWYEILTGLDCRDNDYKPVYTYGGETFELSDELVTAIKEAAHQAVAQRNSAS